MNSRTLNGVLLVAGSAVALAGLGIWTLIMGDAIPGSAAEDIVTALGENAGTMKPLVLVITLAILMSVGGLKGITESMTGGSGGHYAKLGFFLVGIGFAGAVIESALIAGTADAAEAGSATASTLYAGSTAVGSVSTALAFIGYGIIGVGIFVQKNFNTTIAALMILTGIAGTSISVANYNSMLLGIGYLGHIGTSIALGVVLLRSKD